MTLKKKVIKIAAVADLHCKKTNQEFLHTMFMHIAKTADVLVMCGDLVDSGVVEEAHILASEISATIRIPAIGVLGNHDYEADKQDEIKNILCNAGVMILDGEVFETQGIGFAGVKGFGGGFGRYQLGSWGEQTIKHFVQEAMDEGMKLESALVKLSNIPRIVLMHYSPIKETVVGESLEIYPFLGSSRLEEPVNWFDVSLVIHGHAHYGTPEGFTAKNIPVYNVAIPLLNKLFPHHPPFRLLEFPRNGG